ncbi:MAG: phospholipase [Paludibacteraceae bacterium]|nr:phospholipase [Paludibacteraceae bacterium]
MIPLLLFIVLAIVVLVLTEIRERQKAKNQEPKADSRPDGCCGEHLVCERETLLQTNAEIVYYDDEELDQLADTPPEDFTPAQHQMMREVFETLREADIPGWCRSLQLRRISLPEDIREEALMIVRERRNRPS